MADPPDLSHLRAVAEQAEAHAPGPWRSRGGAVSYGLEGYSVARVSGEDRRREDLAAHIAAFDPPTVRWLCSELERLGAENEALREALGEIRAAEVECSLPDPRWHLPGARCAWCIANDALAAGGARRDGVS